MDIPFTRFPYQHLVKIVITALQAAGLSQDRAAEEAGIIIDADLLGVPSHGIRMLPTLLTAIGDGRVNPAPNVKLLRHQGASCLLDGDNGPGRSVAWQAMQEAMNRGRTYGIGTCLALHTTHWGRAHAYASRAAAQGMIGICMTNGMPCMAGWGATRSVIGNNPIAIGIPRSDPDRPVVLDMAMSQAAVGTVGTWLREGRTVPQGWGLDANGKPSSNGAEILNGGAVLPFGNHKGAGLALMIELLTAALAGGALSPEIERRDKSGLDPDACKLFITINPEFFGSREILTARVDDFLHYLDDNASHSAPFRWPGERGWQAREQNLKHGIPVHNDIIAALTAAGLDF